MCGSGDRVTEAWGSQRHGEGGGLTARSYFSCRSSTVLKKVCSVVSTLGEFTQVETDTHIVR